MPSWSFLKPFYCISHRAIKYSLSYRERLEIKAKGERQQSDNTLDLMPVTKKFLFSIMESAELLCNVTIESSRSKPTAERSVSHCISAPDCGQQTQPGEYLPRVALDLPHVDLRFRVTRETISRVMYENWKKRRSFFFFIIGIMYYVTFY